MITDIPSFSSVRVLVVGDVMMDKYWHGDTNRVSPEAPVPVVHVSGQEQRPGGAGNVAVNIAELGAQVTLVGMVGNDDAGRALTEQLERAGVRCCFHYSEVIPTVTKLRVVSRQQQLIRMDFEESVPVKDHGFIESALRQQIDDVDLVVFSDYAKGALRRVQSLIGIAVEAGKAVLVDPKQADFSQYGGATVVTPNINEFEAVVGACDDEQAIVAKGFELLESHNLGSLLLTRGEHGMTLLSQDPGNQRRIKQMPTHAREVYDVTGAGDTVISVLAVSLAKGLDIHIASFLSNIAAGLVVGKFGTASVTPEELRGALLDHHAEHQGVVGEDELMSLIHNARKRGESIVMTNGCFDILHIGHVSYLEQASRLGDRMVVAVNIDETVRALKGQDRPVNTVSDRMGMLAALSCVDWVVPFAEQTPERLICRIKPDYLVKGGDNTPEKIPGYHCVTGYGGEVLVLDYVDGCSTTNIIETIRAG